jgi:hypothetical protein
MNAGWQTFTGELLEVLSVYSNVLIQCSNIAPFCGSAISACLRKSRLSLFERAQTGHAHRPRMIGCFDLWLLPIRKGSGQGKGWVTRSTGMSTGLREDERWRMADRRRASFPTPCSSSMIQARVWGRAFRWARIAPLFRALSLRHVHRIRRPLFIH